MDYIPAYRKAGKENPKSIKLVFHKMVTLCKRLDLIGRKVIATDGTKLRAQNSEKNNFNQKKTDDQLAYMENHGYEPQGRALDPNSAAEQRDIIPSDFIGIVRLTNF